MGSVLMKLKPVRFSVLTMQRSELLTGVPVTIGHGGAYSSCQPWAEIAPTHYSASRGGQRLGKQKGQAVLYST